MLSRRTLIGKAAVGAAAAVALGAARTGIASTRALRAAPDERPGERAQPADAQPGQSAAPPAVATGAAPPPWELVRPFVAGAVVAHGWRLSDLSPVQDGSSVATLTN